MNASAAVDRLGQPLVLALKSSSGGAVRLMPPLRSGLGWRRPVPLLLLLGRQWFGPAIEMTRLLAGSSEIRACAVAVLETDDEVGAELIREAIELCRRQLRIDRREIALFADAARAANALAAFASGNSGATRCIVSGDTKACTMLATFESRQAAQVACTVVGLPAGASPAVAWKLAPESVLAGLAMPALIHGLRQFWARAHRYGDEVMPLTKATTAAVLERLAPVLRPLTGRAVHQAERGNPHVVRSDVMGRDFEVFARVPDVSSQDQPRRFAAVVALDANGGFATVAAIASSLAAAGHIEPCIVVGVGTPRSQGELEFGYRRFEELSPPADAGMQWNDPLSCAFRSLYALRGQDARTQLGRASEFYAFLTEELLPKLCKALPIDPDAICLLGHSAAGTFVAYAMTKDDAPFSGYACLSPGTAISDDWMLRHARIAPGVQMYSAIGSEELDNDFNKISGIPRAPEFVEQLRATGAQLPPCEVLEGETHTTVYPRAVAQALRGLLPASR